mgnify:FL=1
MNVIEIRTRFNPFAELIVLILAIGLGYGILTEIVIKASNELPSILGRSLVGIILFLIFQTVPLIGYYNLKKQTMKSLQKYFRLTKIKIKKHR